MSTAGKLSCVTAASVLKDEQEETGWIRERERETDRDRDRERQTDRQRYIFFFKGGGG